MMDSSTRAQLVACVLRLVCDRAGKALRLAVSVCRRVVIMECVERGDAQERRLAMKIRSVPVTDGPQRPNEARRAVLCPVAGRVESRDAYCAPAPPGAEEHGT